MKQKIYILGVITLALIFTATLFKLNHLFGAGILMTAGVFLLVMVFLPLALINNYRTASGIKNGVLYWITWITCLAVFGSALFKIQHWPGAGELILVALPFPFVVFLPVYLYVNSKIRNPNIYHMMYVLFLLVFMAVFSALLSLNVSPGRIDQSLALADNYKDLTVVLKGKGSASTNGESDDYEVSLNKSTDKLLTTVEQCRELLLERMQTTDNQLRLNGGRTRMIDSRSLAAAVLLTEEQGSPAAHLESDISEFIRTVGEAPGCDSLAIFAADLLKVNTQDVSEPSWGKRMFENQYLSWVLIYLTSVEANTLLIKEEALMLR